MTTVESSFRLVDRASGTIRSIRRELGELEVQAKRTGAALDELSGPRVAREMEAQAREMRVLGQETRSTGTEFDSTGQSVDRLVQRTQGLETQSRRTRLEMGQLGQALRLLKLPAIVAAVGGLVQVLGALTGGAVELLPKILDVAGAGASWGSVMVGAGAAVGVTKLATEGLSSALQGNKKALADLTPEGRSFVAMLRSMRPEIAALRDAAQRGLMPGVGDLLGSLKSQAPALRSIISQAAGSVGGLAQFAGQQMKAPGFMRDLGSVVATGGRAFSSAGRAAFYLGQGLEQVLIAAQPLTDWLGRMAVREAKLVDEHATLARETGTLGSYFDKTRKSLEQMGDIGSKVFDGIRGLMRAASGQSDSLWGSVDRLATRFDAWSNSFKGQDAMRTWFANLRPALSETVGLFGDIGKAIGKLTTGTQGAAMMRALRDAIPSLTSGLQSLTASLGPAVVGAFGSVVRLFGDMAGQAGPLTLVARSVGLVAAAADQLVRALGPVGRAVGTAFLAFGLLKKMNVFSALDALRAKWSGAGAAAGGAAVEERAAATIGGASALVGAGRLTAAEEVAGGRAVAGGTMRPSGLIIPAGARSAETAAVEEESSSAGLLSRGLSGAAGLAGRFLLPLMGIQGLFGALGTPGNLGQRIQGGMSAATFGLIPAPITTAERRQMGAAQGQAFVSNLGTGGSLASQRKAISKLRSQIGTAQDWRSKVPTDLQGMAGSQVTPELKAGTAVLQTELHRREQMLRQSQQAVDRELDATSIKHAQALVTDFSSAFSILDKAKGPEDAMKETVTHVLDRMATLRPAGQKVLGDSMLDWAHQQERDNPKLASQYDKLIAGIKGDFTDLGKHVQVVNDLIYTGTRSEWQSIAAAMMNPAEQAKEQVTAAFTAIQVQAISSLTAMGFTQSQARQLVRGAETAQGARTLNTAAKLASSSNAGARQAGLDIPGAVKLGNSRATGGRMYRLPGSGTLDTVAMADGGLGAPGELVVNQNTERDVDHDLSMAGKPTLDMRVRRETRPHHRRAFGGRMGASVVVDPGVNMSVGQEPTILRDLRSLSNELGQTVYVISGYRSPAHSVAVGGFADDPHTRGQAADIGVGSPSLASMFGVREAQLRAVGLYRPFYPPDAHEVNHVQLLGGGASGTPTSGVGAAAGAFAMSPQQIKALRVPATSLAGVPGAMVTRAGSIYATALRQRINQALGLGAGGGASFSGSLSGSTPNQVRQFFGSEGFNRIAIAGMLGNAMQESSMKWNEPGGGLFQQISNFGAGAPPLRVQLQTMLPQVMGLRAAMNAAGSPGAAAQIFEQGFEKAGIPAMSNRIRYANAAYASGYTLGGRMPAWGGWNASGADVTVNRPTVFGAGEAGAERVRITPAGRGGGHQITIQRGAVQVNGTGGGPALERYVDMRLLEFARDLADEIEAGEEEPASVVTG